MPAGEDIFRRLGVESRAGDLLPSSVALFPEGQSARALDQYFPRKGILTKEPDHSFGFFYAGAPFAPPRPINSIPRDVIEALLIFLFFAFTLHPSPFSPRLARLRRPKTHGAMASDEATDGTAEVCAARRRSFVRAYGSDGRPAPCREQEQERRRRQPHWRRQSKSAVADICARVVVRRPLVANDAPRLRRRIFILPVEGFAAAPQGIPLDGQQQRLHQRAAAGPIIEEGQIQIQAKTLEQGGLEEEIPQKIQPIQGPSPLQPIQGQIPPIEGPQQEGREPGLVGPARHGPVLQLPAHGMRQRFRTAGRVVGFLAIKEMTCWKVTAPLEVIRRFGSGGGVAERGRRWSARRRNIQSAILLRAALHRHLRHPE